MYHEWPAVATPAGGADFQNPDQKPGDRRRPVLFSGRAGGCFWIS
jgi:hypothetical protein